MRILLTGGTGHLGHYLAQALLAKGARVLIATPRPPAAGQRLAGAEYATVDIADGAGLGRLLARGIDAVFHLAGKNAAADDKGVRAVNVRGTQALLTAVTALDRPQLPLIMTSSSAVYGACKDDPITEDSPLAPLTAYGSTKMEAEALALALHRQTGQHVIVARPFNIIGPGQDKPLLYSAVASQLAAIEAGRQPPIVRTGALNTWRDLTDVRDVAAALVALLSRGASGVTYNICFGQATLMRDLVTSLMATSGVQAVLEQGSHVPAALDVPYQRGSHARLSDATGWQPQIGLDRSLLDTLNYWRNLEKRREMASKPES